MRHTTTLLMAILIVGLTADITQAQVNRNGDSPANRPRPDAPANAEGEASRVAPEEENDGDKVERSFEREAGRARGIGRDRDHLRTRRRDEYAVPSERARRDGNDRDSRNRTARRDDADVDRDRRGQNGLGYDWDPEIRHWDDRAKEWRFRRFSGHLSYWAPGGFWTSYRNGRWYRYDPSPDRPAKREMRYHPRSRLDERHAQDTRYERARRQEDRYEGYGPDGRPPYDGGSPKGPNGRDAGPSPRFRRDLDQRSDGK
ncbi:MAG: hypothetical protein ACQESR_09520 [Planctomycetota bacterium]